MENQTQSRLKEPILKNFSNPVIILIDPQLGENIGMVARAMLNCGLTELRLVRPRDGWPNQKAFCASAGATSVLNNAQIFDNTNDAIGDLKLVYATTKRDRDMNKAIVTPHQAAKEIVNTSSNDCGIMFGGEANGLKNDDVVLADKILMIPLNPEFSSLNLSQAVLIIAYELFIFSNNLNLIAPKHSKSPIATKGNLLGLFTQLEETLEEGGFFRVLEKKPVTIRNLRNLFQRAQLTEQEVQTLRGAINCLRKIKPN